MLQNSREFTQSGKNLQKNVFSNAGVKKVLHSLVKEYETSKQEPSTLTLGELFKVI